MSHRELESLAENFVAKLGEHCDAVQIMLSWNENGQTYCLKRGCGNWYARQGMAHEFINEDIAADTARQIASSINPPDSDDGDEWKNQP